ncbi:hypothetical protein I4U23_005520 [Adineta vaga]|uniref:Uncharacterized protein n=1 Tax=Adineta vaga TaxID=104782 RepID=B3G4H4_ADIVA|nr:unknown [Adineta vaga]UJR18613.1 hypothetical protein I4U23_005520 [Adineta vaga]
MLIIQINLAILILSNILLLAADDQQKEKNRLSFDVPRRLLFHSNKEHLLFIGKNAANISTNGSRFNIRFRYSIHDFRLIITDSNDDHKFYKVMCNIYYKCRILQDGIELIRLNGSIIKKLHFDTFSNRQSINIGNNWTMLIMSDEDKVMLFHAAYSNQQPLVELAPFKLSGIRSMNCTYSINIIQQPLFKPAFLIAMGIIVDGLT